MSVRWLCGLALLATAALGCTKLNPGRCDQTSDCDAGMCNTSTNLCEAGGHGGAGGKGGQGGVGGAAGAKGTGGMPFTCPNAMCTGKTPICDQDAGSCRGCNTEKTTACGSLDAGTPLCAPGDAGSKAGMCVGCLMDSDCKTPRPPSAT